MRDALSQADAAHSQVEHFGEYEDIEAILETIFQRYGYDFRNYSRAHLKRRLVRRMLLANLPSLAKMKERIAEDRNLFESIVGDFSILVTEMFRDPEFFRALRRDVIPYLSTQPFLKVWVAGCATGEEAYSIAILLQEEGIFERSLIYATDIDATALEMAQKGIFDAKDIRTYTENYQKSGGEKPFVNYYKAFIGVASLEQKLKKNILFAHHNLASDGSFGEMHLILCRNVMIYFNKELHERAFNLFRESLAPRGFLGIGSKESMRFAGCAMDFEQWVKGASIYRRRD